MKAVKYSAGKVEVHDVPEPHGEGVRVRIVSAGICASDLALLDSNFDIAGIPGHEMAGVTAGGAHVAIEPVAPCGVCEFCLTGNYQICRLGIAAIFGVGRNGGMAEEILVPERCLVRLPGRIDAKTACLVEPLAVAIHGMRRADAKSGERVVVIGGGTIGLCAVAAAKDFGCTVALSAKHAHQSEAGARLGAGEPSGEFDIAVECAGSESGIRDACGYLRPNGRLLLLSASWGDIKLPGLVVAAKEPIVVGSTMYGKVGAYRDIDRAARLLGEVPAIAAVMITHRFPLVAAADAFALARERKAGVIKVVLEP